MLRWLSIFRRKARRTTDADRPDVELVQTLARQISIPQKAGPVLEAVELFGELDDEARRSELPRVYLLVEQYLTDVDPVRTLTRAHLRDNVRTQFPELIREAPFSIVFETTERQELLLCRHFLLDVLDRAIHVLGRGSTLSAARQWIRHAPDLPPLAAPLDLDIEPPGTDAAWIAALTTLAQSLYQQLRVGLGEATVGIYDAAYAALAHGYAGLETFPIVVRLLPDGLLDEQRIQSLARHATMARVQGELSRAQRSALDTATQLQAVLSTVGEGIVTVDEDGAIVLVNREIERTFGYAADDLIGTELAKLLSMASVDGPEDFFQRLGESVSVEGRRSDGSTFPVELCVNETLISDQLFYTAAVRDVTIQRDYERELLRARDHAEEMTRLKTAFLANVSHEIRTPISGIIGAVQILDEEVPEDQKEFTRMINESAHRLLSTLDSVLEFARLESGDIECPRSRVAVGSILQDLDARYASRAREKDISLRVEPADVTAMAHREALERILDILVKNAIRFTHRGSVVVTVRAVDDGVRIEVHDDGIGISPSFLPHVFDEFRQESIGHARSHEGTGLGLAIASRLAQAMDGRLEAESTPGRGSTFSLTLQAAGIGRQSGVRAASRELHR
jgi:PAS domain S-box-containing protein